MAIRKIDAGQPNDLASAFFDAVQFGKADPQPGYQPNFDAADTDPAPPERPTGGHTYDFYRQPTQQEKDQMGVETAAAKWRLANLPQWDQLHTEDPYYKDPKSLAKEDRSYFGDVAMAHTGVPALAGLASLFDPAPLSDPTNTDIPFVSAVGGLGAAIGRKALKSEGKSLLKKGAKNDAKNLAGIDFVGPPPKTAIHDLFDPRTLDPNEDPAVSRERLRQFYERLHQEMQFDPENRIQPNPAHQTIDTDYKTPAPFVGPMQDLSQLYARHPDPAAELPNFDRARFFMDPVRKEAIAQKLVEKIRNSGIEASDARYFYNSAGPLYRMAKKYGLSDADAMAYIRDVGKYMAATSPKTRVEPNVRSMASVMAKEAAGIPFREVVGPGTINKKTGLPGISESGIPVIAGEGGLHGILLDKVNAGENIPHLTNTKPAVFSHQVGEGNLSGVTADSHVIRNVVMTANELYPGEIPPAWIKAEHRAAYAANPNTLTPDMVDDTLGSQMVNGQKMQTEFPIIADQYHRVAEILGVQPAEAQAMGWFGMGGETNLGSDWATTAKVINDRISVTAQALGKTPDEIAELLVRRKIPLMSIMGVGGGAAAGAAALGSQPPVSADPGGGA